MLERYLKAVEYAGATLEWNDAGIVLHTVETLDRSKLEPWLVRLGRRSTLQSDPTLARVPDTAIALASGHLDAPAFYHALCQIVPEQDRAEAYEPGNPLRRPSARSRSAHANPAATRTGRDRVSGFASGRALECRCERGDSAGNSFIVQHLRRCTRHDSAKNQRSTPRS